MNNKLTLLILIMILIAPVCYGISSSVQLNSSIGNDTYLKQNTAITNYGTDTLLHINKQTGQVENTIIYFNVSNYIPSGYTVTSANLSLYKEMDTGTDDVYNISRITQAWTENGATWTDYDGVTPWGTSGGDYTGSYFSSTIGTGTGWYNFTITNLVNEWLNGTSANEGLIIYQYPSSAGDAEDHFSSRESLTAAQRPTFHFEYSETNPINITWLSQFVADVNGSNVIGNPLEINYSITDVEGVNESSVVLYYKTNSTVSNVFRYVNGTPSSGYYTRTGSNISENWTFNLFDNMILPAVYNLEERPLELTPHQIFSMNTTDTWIKIGFLEMYNDTQYNFFEFMVNNTYANGTTPSLIYFCNSSYSTGNPITDSNCASVGSLAAQTAWNHNHSAYSYHQVNSIAGNVTTGELAGIKITDESFFLMKGGNGDDSFDAYYVPNQSRPTAAQYTTDNGLTWQTLSGTFDSHLHQYSPNNSLYYYLCANDTNGLGNCSAVRQDLLELAGLSPNSPDVYAPVEGNYSGMLDINYTTSLSPNGYAITGYNITLVNETFDYVQTIVSNNYPNLSYSWDSSTAPDGNYYIRLQAEDNLSQLSSYGYSELITLDNTAPGIFIASPGYCYQESANVSDQTGIDGGCDLNYSGSYSVSSNYIYINYTKPVGVINATWLVKHGEDGPENYDIPTSCFSYSATEVILRFYSYNYGSPSQLRESYGECYNGTSWELVTTNKSESLFSSVTLLYDSYGRFYDGDWDTETVYHNQHNSWVQRHPSFRNFGNIYEEAMLWNVNFEYTNSYINLNTLADETVDTWWYTLDSGVTNVSFTPGINVTFANGINNLVVYANDSYGNENYSEVNFTVNDTTVDYVINSPVNGTNYIVSPIVINVTGLEELKNVTYSFNGGANQTATNVSAIQWNADLFPDPQSSNNVTIYIEDIIGNVVSETLSFNRITIGGSGGGASGMVSPKDESDISLLYDVVFNRRSGTNFKMSVSILDNNPTLLLFTDNILQFNKVEFENWQSSESFESYDLSFKVPVDKHGAKIWQYQSGEWVRLLKTEIDEDDDYTYYKAFTDHEGQLFAITHENGRGLINGEGLQLDAFSIILIIFGGMSVLFLFNGQRRTVLF